MAAGKFNMQANDGAVIGLIVPDGLTSGERQISLGVNLSGITAYHLLQGNLAVSASTITQGFNTTLYTSGSTTTGIDMSTQWGDTAEEKFGGLVWLKDRAEATNWFLYDTIRGATKEINSNTTEAEATLAGGLTSFGSTGFTVGADAGHNSTTNNMYSANFQTTHRVAGTTNHGKAYTCHFNPFTGFTIVKYEGSGLAGHEIPHMLGRKLGFATQKNLTTAGTNWRVFADGVTGLNTSLRLDGTDAIYTDATEGYANNTDTVLTLSTNSNYNGSTNQHIMYGWANSYLDESNKLIGNYELVTYQGTGVAGNKVKTKGKPAWVMIKRTDATGNWVIFDNVRTDNKWLYPNLLNVEDTQDSLDFMPDGFTLKDADARLNASGGQYIALVVYDTNSNGGGSYYPLASDTANVQINNALIPLAQGIDSNGAKNIILSKNETITGLTYAQGKNYVYCDKNGAYGVTSYKPRYLESELVRTYAGEQPDYFDVNKNKWFNTSGQGELVSNGTFDSNTTGWSTTTGFTISVQNGTLKIDRNITTPTGGVYQVITTNIGKKYRLVLDIDYISGGGVTVWVDSGNTLSSYITVLGKQVIEFTAINSLTKIEFLQNGVAGTGTINIDSVSVFATDIVPTTEITNGRNYLNHIVHADNDGGVLYVEELPKIEYKDIIKANEFKGKNACTAWVSFDGTTTPPTIRDSYNVSAVIRTATGIFDIYFKEPMDNINYSVGGSVYALGSNTVLMPYAKSVTKAAVVAVVTTGSGINCSFTEIQTYGGKN